MSGSAFVGGCPSETATGRDKSWAMAGEMSLLRPALRTSASIRTQLPGWSRSVALWNNATC